MAFKITSLGIDFGSSVTSVVGFAEGSEAPIWFARGQEGGYITAVAVPHQGDRHNTEDWLFFEDTLKRIRDSHEVFDDLKEKIDLPDEPDKKEEAKAFFKRLFREMASIKDSIHKQTVFDFSGLTRVCYGCPEYELEGRKETYSNIMDGILRQAIKDEFRVENADAVNIVSEGEAVLAALTFRKYGPTSNWREDDVMFVMDFGGFTFDMALVKISSGGVVPLRCKSMPLLFSHRGVAAAGKNISYDICEEAEINIHDRGVDKAKIDLFTRKDFVSERHQLAYEYESSEAKIQLVYNKHDKVIDFEIFVNGASQKKGKSKMMQWLFYNAEDHITKFLKYAEDENKISPQSIAHVLFTGGTSRIEPLRTHVKTIMSHWISDLASVHQIDGGADGSNQELSQTGVFERASDLAKAQYGGEILKKPLSSENVVALGAALVASDEKMIQECLSRRKKTSINPSKSESFNKQLNDQKKNLLQAVYALQSSVILNTQADGIENDTSEKFKHLMQQLGVSKGFNDIIEMLKKLSIK